ncbi:EF hand family [Cryptosporidium sp. chipmunk genotype I]|uniref:EF hand family n=1 Tax=Cryptosporidium sp. chipmunk genotype I TaxID=1280935 RepID=UPI00351A86CD|nr:EF hand family [Cryptosporidium sp. chipmunk genotype I]
MLNSNLSKPVQLNRKTISGTKSSAKKGILIDEPTKPSTHLKRRPSIDLINEELLKQESKAVNKEKSNLATRPEPISKALLEEARARRVNKLTTKQVTSSPKSKAVKQSPQKKVVKTKSSVETSDKIVEPAKKQQIKKEVIVDHSKELEEELERLLNEISELKEKEKNYRSEINELKTDNEANLNKIKILEKQKEEQFQNKRNLQLSKELLESGHQQNIDKIQKLIKGCRRELTFGNESSSGIYDPEKSFNKKDKFKTTKRKKENDMGIMGLLLCDKVYDKSYLDQLIMIEESNGNIWGLSSRDLNELNAVLNIYNSNGMNSTDIKSHLNNLSWFLEISSQRNSSLPHIATALDKISSNKLDFKEFLSFLLVPLFSSSHYSYLDQLFDLFDMDSDSFISLDDMKGVIKEIEWEEAFSINDLRFLLKQMSTNIFSKNIDSESSHNILISREEFNEFFRSILD